MYLPAAYLKNCAVRRLMDEILDSISSLKPKSSIFIFKKIYSYVLHLKNHNCLLVDRHFESMFALSKDKKNRTILTSEKVELDCEFTVQLLTELILWRSI